jgi:uncharacterized repeat protein (TIGR01451 family)
MHFTSAPARRVLAAWLIVAGGLVGCAQHRIPAIDPTGQHIFSGTTTLASHDLLGRLHHRHHQPQLVPVGPPVVAGPVAAVPAPVKPPCAPPIEAVPVVPVAPVPIVAVPQNPVAIVPVACGPQAAIGRQPQMVLPGRPQPGGPIYDPGPPVYPGPELRITPARIVAPVNTEVVMAAGICSPDGYYVTRQPLEWMVAQDGVGQIVAVGHESPHNASLVLRSSPQKIATNYARAHTSTISQVLNRGTPTPGDDVYLHRGQSWISLTSPTEGTSHVVVWAPKEQNWDRRKATATIYWVDAAWRFPPSVTARAGRPQPLTTVVTRAGGEPISGWIVRYEVVDGPPASLARNGATAIEVRTDGAGRATADLSPASLEPGITTVRVQIVRPGTARGDLPQMVVGQGMLGVQWTTPGLAVRALGSSAVTADGAIAYRVEVTNGGDLVTHNVVLSYTPPTGVTVLNSTPAAQPFGQRLQWQLGDLPPGTTSVVELNCRASVAGAVRSAFVATSAEVPQAEARVTTDVRVNALVIKMMGPETVEVGREAKFLIDVTNTGGAPLTNVTATDTFDPGLAHAAGERSPIVRPIPVIGPGQTERFAIPFIVTQPGRHCHRLDVTADGGHAAGARACVTGTAPMAAPAQLSVRVAGPTSSRAGEVASYSVEVKNNGSAPATNVVLAVSWGVNLELLAASAGHEDNIPRLTTQWRIAQVAGGETITRQLNFRCLNADEQGAVVRATVSSQQSGAVANQIATVILPGAAAPRTAPPQSATPIRPDGRPAPSPPAGGALRVTASATANPIMLGGTTTYIINIANERGVPDQEVALSVQVIGDGLTIRASGTTPTPVTGASPTAIDFAPIREMRPGEQLATPYRIEVRGVKPGTHRLRISATSALDRAGVLTEAELGVNAP